MKVDYQLNDKESLFARYYTTHLSIPTPSALDSAECRYTRPELHNQFPGSGRHLSVQFRHCKFVPVDGRSIGDDAQSAELFHSHNAGREHVFPAGTYSANLLHFGDRRARDRWSSRRTGALSHGYLSDRRGSRYRQGSASARIRGELYSRYDQLANLHLLGRFFLVHRPDDRVRNGRSVCGRCGTVPAGPTHGVAGTTEIFRNVLAGYLESDVSPHRECRHPLGTISAGADRGRIPQPFRTTGALVPRQVSTVRYFRMRRRELLFPGDTMPGGGKLPNGVSVIPSGPISLPRLGVAWDPKGDGRMTVRVAYGIFYDLPNLYWNNNIAYQPPLGLSQQSDERQFPGNPWATNPGGNPPSSAGGLRQRNISGKRAVLQHSAESEAPTYIQQWNLTVQRQFGSNWLVLAGYLGNDTVHLWGTYDANQAVLHSRNLPSAAACSYYREYETSDANCSCIEPRPRPVLLIDQFTGRRRNAKL